MEKDTIMQHYQQQEEEEQQQQEQEEALSLCDLPLGDHQEDNSNNIKNNKKMQETTEAGHQSITRRSSSEPPEFFEFLSVHNPIDMCSAEDIFFHGKLIPFYNFPDPVQNRTENRKQSTATFRRRCESLSELQSSVMISRSNSTKAIGLMRNSRSLDYRRLERFSSSKKPSPESNIERNPSVKSVEIRAGDHSMLLKKSASNSKPRWYNLLTFGMVRPPPTGMELRDIKSRQVRLNPHPVSIFQHPTSSTGGNMKIPANENLNKGPCGLLLKVLSCKDPTSTSVAVTTSFCMPQV